MSGESQSSGGQSREELLAEKAKLERAKRDNERELNRLKSRADDGRLGKKHLSETAKVEREGSQIDAALKENQQELDSQTKSSPGLGSEERGGDQQTLNGPGRRGYDESELTYSTGSPHDDHEFYKSSVEGQRAYESGLEASTSESVGDATGHVIDRIKRNDSPAVSQEMDDHFYARHGKAPYTDKQPRAGSAYTPEQAEADNAIAEELERERMKTKAAEQQAVQKTKGDGDSQGGPDRDGAKKSKGEKDEPEPER